MNPSNGGSIRAYDLVSFDLDGTLVDTAGEIAEAVNRGLETCGFRRWPIDDIVHLVGAGLVALVDKLHARLLEAEPAQARRVGAAELFHAVDRHYIDTTGTLARPYPGAAQALDRLRAAGVRLACVTNKEARHAERVLAVTGLADRFELMIGGDSLPQKKPHASVLQHAMAHFAVTAARTAHVGDSWIDVQAARNAGVQAWAVDYGYNAGVPISESSPDQLFSSLPGVADRALP